MYFPSQYPTDETYTSLLLLLFGPAKDGPAQWFTNGRILFEARRPHNTWDESQDLFFDMQNRCCPIRTIRSFKRPFWRLFNEQLRNMNSKPSQIQMWWGLSFSPSARTGPSSSHLNLTPDFFVYPSALCYVRHVYICTTASYSRSNFFPSPSTSPLDLASAALSPLQEVCITHVTFVFFLPDSLYNHLRGYK